MRMVVFLRGNGGDYCRPPPKKQRRIHLGAAPWHIASISPPETFRNMGPLEAGKIRGISKECHSDWLDTIWLSIGIIIMSTGMVANLVLLWLFLRERKPLSASQVLGMNLVVMDLIYLSAMPLSWIDETGHDQVNETTPATAQERDHATNPYEMAEDVFCMLNLTGCPLLLACMCIERYLAVVRPVLYLRLRKREYRMAVSAVVWVITLSFCLAAGIVKDSTLMMVPTSILIMCLFFLMLACLGGVVWSLSQQSPAHSAYCNQGRPTSPQKRQAVCNVLAVVVPAVITYLPVLLLVPLVFCVSILGIPMTRAMCNIFGVCFIFPSLGALIGPLFYLSKARQMCCLSGITRGAEKIR